MICGLQFHNFSAMDISPHFLVKYDEKPNSMEGYQDVQVISYKTKTNITEMIAGELPAAMHTN